MNQFSMADLYSLHVNSAIGKKWQLGATFISFHVDGILKRPDLRSIYDIQSRRDTVRAMTAQGFKPFSNWESVVFINMSRNFLKTVDPGWWTSPFPLKIPVGINFKILNKSLHDLDGYGIGLDIGTMGTFSIQDLIGRDWLGELTLGISLTNAPETLIYWDSGKTDKLQMGIIYGFGYNQVILKNFLKVQYINQYTTNDDAPSFGIETTYRDNFAVRFGKKNNQIQGGIGLNMQIRYFTAGIDYGFMSHILGNAHRFGLTIQF